jgi:hypothetical protein
MVEQRKGKACMECDKEDIAIDHFSTSAPSVKIDPVSEN